MRLGIRHACQYRLWRAVSWGGGNAVMGNVAQISFDYNFILFGGLTAVELVLIAAVLPARTRSELKLRADDARLHLQEEERAARYDAMEQHLNALTLMMRAVAQRRGDVPLALGAREAPLDAKVAAAGLARPVMHVMHVMQCM